MVTKKQFREGKEMARVKSAMTTRARHKKVLKQAKGYYGAKHYRFRNANQAVLKS